MKRIIRIERSPRRSLTALVLAGTIVIQSIAPSRLAAQTVLNARATEKETDKRQMRQIYDAIQAYRKKHGDLPRWLSDLVPDFVADREIFISPVERRTGEFRLFGYSDPKLKTSYIYEFSANIAGGTINQNRDTPVTMKEWKTMQMAEFGPATPMLRCHLHDPVLNISFSGEYYETSLYWESDPNTLALVKRLGQGPGVKDAKTILVKVLDPENGQPLSEVEVTASNRQSELGPLPPRVVKTDSQGQGRITLGGSHPRSIALSFSKLGYANAPIRWDSEDAIPTEFTAKLNRAVTVGGIVRDPTGKPVAGVTVTISGVVRDEAGQFLLAEYDSVQTDASGKWSSGRVVKDFSTLQFKLTHPEFLPAEYDQAATDPPAAREVSKAELLAAKAVMELQPGVRVEGTVVGDESQPVPGAEVILRNISESPKRRVQRTDEKGRFALVILEEADFHLVVEAQGYSPTFTPVRVEPGLKPLSIHLAHGKAIKGRVLDGDGKPMAGASVSVSSWHNLPLLSWSVATDAEGRFAWDSAPDGPLNLTAAKAGLVSASQPVSPGRADEITFKLVKTFLLTGKAIDAETKEPIKQFKIVRGYAWSMMDGEQVNWEFYDEKTGADGEYSVTLDQRRGGDRLKFMAWADGYLPASSPAFPETGWHTFDFAMKKGSGPKGVVQTADGRPVADVQVALLGAGYLSLGKGTLKRLDQRGTVSSKTDAQGQFSLPAALPNPTIVAVHEQGYAEVSAEDLAKDNKITLLPWGSVEGVLKKGTKPWPGENVMLAPKQGGMISLNYDWENFKVTTDPDGRFAFTHVPPGSRQIVRLVPMGDGNTRGWMWSDAQPISVTPGAVTKVTYGGVGRPVTGKLAMNDLNRKVDWNSGHRSFGTRYPRPPGNLRTQEEMREWYNSPEMKKAREAHRNYAFQVAEDGSFRLENVLPGTYDMSVYLTEPSAERFGSGPPIGSLTKEVVVDEIPGGVTEEPLDLGRLTMQAISGSANLPIAALPTPAEGPPPWINQKPKLIFKSLSPVAAKLVSAPQGSDHSDFGPGVSGLDSYLRSDSPSYRIVPEGLKQTAMPYTDRKYTVQQLPQSLQGLTLLQTKNGHKGVRDGQYRIVLSVDKPAYLFLAIDDRMIRLWHRDGAPEWIKEFSPTDYRIVTDDPTMQEQRPYQVVVKPVPAGEIKLGPPWNQLQPVPAYSMYFGFVGSGEPD